MTGDARMRMFYGGQWRDAAKKIEVKNPFDGSTIDTVPSATAEDVAAALDGAARGAKVMADLQPYKRYQILLRTAQLMEQRADDLGRIISQEEGKTLTEGRIEALRAKETIEFSAEEAKRLG